MKNRHITAFILLMTGTLAVRFFGLLREILLAKYYGTGIYTDAYVIANNIPTVLYAAIGSAVSITYVPMYSRAQAELGDARAKRFTWNLLKFLLIVSLFLCLGGEIFTKQVVFLFASGYQGEERLRLSRGRTPCNDTLYADSLTQSVSGGRCQPPCKLYDHLRGICRLGCGFCRQ